MGIVAVFRGRRRRGNPVNGAEGIQEVGARDLNLKREPKGKSNDQKKPSEKARMRGMETHLEKLNQDPGFYSGAGEWWQTVR